MYHHDVSSGVRIAVTITDAATCTVAASAIGAYVVSAIGDPKTLAGRYSESDGGMWMLNLASTHGVVYSVDTRTVMTLPGDTATVLRYARPLAQTESDGRATPKPSPGDDRGSGRTRAPA